MTAEIHLDVICLLAAHPLFAFPLLWYLLRSIRREHTERPGICSEAVDKLAVLTGTTANADFAQLACSSPLDIHAKDYSS